MAHFKIVVHVQNTCRIIKIELQRESILIRYHSKAMYLNTDCLFNIWYNMSPLAMLSWTGISRGAGEFWRNNLIPDAEQLTKNCPRKIRLSFVYQRRDNVTQNKSIKFHHISVKFSVGVICRNNMLTFLFGSSVRLSRKCIHSNLYQFIETQKGDQILSYKVNDSFKIDDRTSEMNHDGIN